MIRYGHAEQHESLGGICRVYRFENSRYSASVVSHEFSYGGNDGLWELAVLYDNQLCYTTPITDDVIGYLTADEVQKILARIDTLRDPNN